MPFKIAVLSKIRAIHDHLLAQVDGLSVGSVPPHLHVVVSMGDRDLTRGRLPLGTDRWETVVKPVPTDHRALPHASARNLAAQEAIEAGADVLIFLDGTVIPGERTVELLARAVTDQGAEDGFTRPKGPVVWCAPVLDLPPVEVEALGYPMGKLGDIALRTPGTPSLAASQLLPEHRWNYFTSTAFAMSAEDWKLSGGFAPDYTGHGLEDADFAETLQRAEGGFVWVGGATAYRQPADPVPADHEDRIAVRHAHAWRQRWGQAPEHPWLHRLVAEGRLRRGRDGEYLAV